MNKHLDEEKLYQAYIHGAGNVMKYKKLLNKINVFPVADGDTGNNLQATMKSIINESRILGSVKDTLESIADASLGGARGNSGIIFAQYLNGVSSALPSGSHITINDFVTANRNSVEYAYNAVTNPVEGTMLTVIRDWADALFNLGNKVSDFNELLTKAYKVLELSLIRTKSQMDVLKKADVVDSGAKGFVLFIRGFIDSIIHGKVNETETTVEVMLESIPDLHIETTYRYCVEAKVSGCRDMNYLKNQLNSLGDSLIVAGNERVARIHIHSDKPEDVFDIINLNDEIISQKVDDMVMQSEIVSNRKYPIALVVDSIADLPADFADDRQICMVPVNIYMNNREYMDKLTTSNEKVLKIINEGDEFPTSSQPDTKTVENLFAYLLEHYDSVIALTVASELSGTYNTFRRAAGNVSVPGKRISVIDSKQNSGSEGLLAVECSDMIARGEKHDEIVRKMEELTGKAKILVSVRNLENMIKGGRLSKNAGRFAERISFKPIVTLDKDGKGTLGGAAFSTKGSLKKLVKEICRAKSRHGIRNYSLIYIDEKDKAHVLAEKLEELIGMKPLYIMQSSSVIAISAGKGAVALSYITE